MKFEASTLRGVYSALKKIDEPLAVFDFLSGEMGYEALCAQAIGGRFWDEHRDRLTVVALCWKGCTAYYENVSHHQVELTDLKHSTLGNRAHQGADRWAWLVLQNHRGKVDKLKNVKAHVGPAYWSGGRVLDQRLCGFIDYQYLREYGLETNRTGLIAAATKRLVREEYTFDAGVSPAEGPYIALFDRNEPRSPDRNTQHWQFRLMRHWAKKFKVGLVLVSGLFPRENIKGALQLQPEHRDVDLLRSVARNALLFAAPPCGAAEAACIFGCNFLALGHLGLGHDQLTEMVARCGNTYLGVLNHSKGPTARAAHDFLRETLKSQC